MSTYVATEQGRAQNQYVYYEFFKMNSQFPNCWSPDYPWCKYWITSNNGVSRRSLFNDSIRDHDIYRDGELYDNNGVKQARNFNDIMAALLTKFDQFKDISPTRQNTILEYFKRVTSINTRGDMTCKLAIYGGARIYVDNIINNINATKNSDELSDVLRNVTAQVNAAALNGAFAAAFNVVNSMGRNAADPNLMDKNLEAKITNIYNSIVFGSKNQGPVNIPNDPTATFELPQKIYDLAAKFEKEHSKTPAQIQSMFIDELMKLINKQARLAPNKGMGGF